MNDRLKRALWRGGRALIAVIIAGLGVKYGQNDLYLLVVPILLAIDKWARD